MINRQRSSAKVAEHTLLHLCIKPLSAPITLKAFMRADYNQTNGLELGYGSLLSRPRLISPIHFPRYSEDALIALSAAVPIKRGLWLTLRQPPNCQCGISGRSQVGLPHTPNNKSNNNKNKLPHSSAGRDRDETARPKSIVRSE